MTYMNKVNLLLTTANGNLFDSKDMIKRAVKKAEEYAFFKLKIDWDIDVLATNRLHKFIIPEDGVGGATYASDFIELAINEKATENLMSEILVHEFCHAARWKKKGEPMKSLFDEIINEGIATYFEFEFAKNQTEKQFFIKTVSERSDEENEKILEDLRSQLNSDNYDYDKIFCYGDNELPRWAGYSLGYYLVKKYLKETGKRIEDAFIDKYADFRTVCRSIENKTPYYVEVNRQQNVVIVYSLGQDGTYSNITKVFVASTGVSGFDTPLGTFTVTDRYETPYLVNDTWGQYGVRINGNIFFHSVPYYTKGAPWDNLEYLEYNKLGSFASAGCVRLATIDAKWIYDNIGYGTTVRIYDSETLPAGVSKPSIIKIDENSPNRGWDPTDPDPSNPWANSTT